MGKRSLLQWEQASGAAGPHHTYYYACAIRPLSLPPAFFLFLPQPSHSPSLRFFLVHIHLYASCALSSSPPYPIAPARPLPFPCAFSLDLHIPPSSASITFPFAPRAAEPSRRFLAPTAGHTCGGGASSRRGATRRFDAAGSSEVAPLYGFRRKPKLGICNSHDRYTYR